jgi:hypothetical protein
MKYLKYIFLALNLTAMIIPIFFHSKTAEGVPGGRQIEWPRELEGKPLQMIELSGAEKGFVADFPGAVGRFTDGSREIIVRLIDRETRKLHPAADCLKGAGYTVKPMPLFVDREGRNWGRVEARRANTVLEVREIIVDSRGNSWHDVSSWFWAGVLKRTIGPYTAFVVSTNASALH